MKKVILNQKEQFLKFSAIVVCALIVTPSFVMFNIAVTMVPEDEPIANTQKNYIPEKPPKSRSVLTENGFWEEVDGSLPGTPSEAFVVVSDTSGIIVVAEFNGFWRGANDTISIPGTTTMKQAGKPDLPRLIEYIEIPYFVNISLEVIYGVPILYEGYNIPPALEEIVPTTWTLSEEETPTLLYDDIVYSSTEYFPSCNVSMVGDSEASTIIMRGRRLLEISFYPIQYSPGWSEVLFYPKFVVKVKYDEPAQIEPVPARLWSEPFERLFEGFLLNYNPWESESGTGPGAPPPPSCAPGTVPASAISVTADYLIITHPNFKFHADRLAAWKTQKGLLAEVITTTEIQVAYPTLSLEEGIEQLIQDAYNTWTFGPTYVLLFGDCEFVPNGYGMVHTSTIPDYSDDETTYEYDQHHRVEGSSPARYYVYDPDNGRIATDSVYFTVHGDDYFPDIIYGRISVDTTTEAETVVDKILSYEMTPPINPDFYNNTLAAAYFNFEDKPRGIENRNLQFVRFAEDIRLHLKELGYMAHHNYSANTTTWTPAGFRSRANQEILFSDSEYGYAHLIGSDWIMPLSNDVGAGNITLNINSDEGRFLVYYNDHGDSKNQVWPFRIDSPGSDWNRSTFEGWCAPMFNISSLPNLTNGDLLPLVITTACSTGWFDGEIDEELLGSRFESNFECFSENITRMSGGGAIAAIGATRIVSSISNGDMLDGIIQAFWPDYLAWQNQPIYGMSAALLFGKINTASNWGYEDEDEMFYTRRTFEAYHLFGDPETELWTAPPSDLAVSYPTQMSTDGYQKFVVTVFNQTDPVYFAKVCIQGEDVYEVGYTDSYGQVLFDIDTSSTQLVNVTVTKHNFTPYLGSIEVINCVAGLTVDPAQAAAATSVTVGFPDFDGGDQIHVYYDETELVISGGNTIVIPEGRVGYANIKANDSDEVAIFLFKRYQGGPPVDPYVYSQNDRETWHLADGRLTYDNPSINVYEIVGEGAQEEEIWRDSTELKVFTNYRVHVNVTNDGDELIEGTIVTLAWAMFSVGRAWTLIGSPIIMDPIQPHYWGETKIDWFTGNTGHICLNATISHINDENENNNVGQENTDVARLQSPGETWFMVGNPTNENALVYLEVRQQCSITDIWRAEIVGLSYQEISSGGFENISLQIISTPGVLGGERRLFTASLYIDGKYMGGISVMGIQEPEPTPTTTGDGIGTLLAIIGAAAGAFVIIAGVIWMKRRK